jgi:hypothetical protein
MNFNNVVVTPLVSNPSDYNIKADILDSNFNKIGDFGVDGIDVFSWWVQQDSVFQTTTVNQFMYLMAQQIVAGTAE